MSHLQYVNSDGVCDYCHKSLSVTPVKVYPNRKIKCGRCSTNNDEEESSGVDSMYNRIATRIFFECINKFDGCTQLLQSSEVLEHEKLCLSKTWICPICLEEMFSFLIIRHFKLNHPESLLENRYFQVTALRNIEKIFLYQLESDLLFVNFRDVSDSFADDLRRFSLNVLLHLGKKDYIKHLKVDFFEKNTDILDKTICTNGNTSVTYNINLNITRESKLMVLFHLNGIESKRAAVNVMQYKINEMKENNNLKSLPKNNSNAKMFHNHLGDYLKTLLFQKRDIFLNDEFKEYISDLAITEKATILYTKLGEKCSITLCCYYCSLIYPICVNSNEVYLLGNNQHCYIVCGRCCINNKSKHLLVTRGFTFTEFRSILFFCIWGCGKRCVYNELYIHERNCIKQICQNCPIKSCYYYFKLYEIDGHFKNQHALVNFQSINSISVHLDTSKPTIEHIMLIWCVCVHVIFKWEQPNWIVSFSWELPGNEILVRIYDKNNKEILIENGSFPHSDEIKVYLRCSVTEQDN